ncbi:MAG: lysophospholipid acyltransferase family protein [Anaerovorax sp.]
MRTIWWFIYFWTYLIGLVPKMKRDQKLKEEGKEEELLANVNQVVYRWASRLLKVAGVQVTVKGLENIPKEPALYVSNHQGNFDIPILLAKLDSPKSIVAKVQMEKMPFISTWMKLFDCVFIDRENPRQSIKVLGQAEENLKQGKSVIIFPEGTRGKGGPLGEFKSGAFKMAFKTKVPIIPVVIDGSYKIMEANGNWIKPQTVKLTILPPISTTDMTKEQSRTIGEEVRLLIENQLLLQGEK